MTDRPGLAEVYFKKAITAIRGHANDHALALLVEAIKRKPDFAEAWVVRGNVLHSMERHFDSLLHYDRALGINDKLHDAWNNRGFAFADLGMWDAAEECFRKSAGLLPALEPHMGLANMYCTLMRLEEAEYEYGEAIRFGAGAEAHFNRGVTLLGMGRWAEGFQEYAHRWANTPYPPRAYRNYPQWHGEDLSRKRIVLFPEQGYGDEILGLRFALNLYDRYPNVYVIVQVRSPLRRLAENCVDLDGLSAIRVVPYNGDEDIAADYSCALLDVPMALNLTPGAVSRDPYLSLDDPHGDWDHWYERITKLPKGLNVGLCWSSGGHLNTARASQITKSIPLPWLKPLAVSGVNLISLQQPRDPAADGFPIADWTDELHDFADTAALIEALDLVITVDTSIAHLAGALGKPVWNFVRFSGYWPWLTPEAAGSPEHSIWYPSMTLLRQPALGNWAQPIDRARKMLSDKLLEKAA